MKKKKCTMCGKRQKLSAFPKKHDNKDKLSNKCRLCCKISFRKYASKNKKRIAAQQRKRAILLSTRNRNFIYNYLLTHPCVKCGEKDPVVLEFDHLRDKKYNISQMTLSITIELIQKEIDKCQILCANCHRRKTAKDFGWYQNIDPSLKYNYEDTEKLTGTSSGSQGPDRGQAHSTEVQIS